MSTNEIIEMLEKRVKDHMENWKAARAKGEERIADMHEGMRLEDIELIELLKKTSK